MTRGISGQQRGGAMAGMGRRGGFTLIEVLVVLIVLGVLAGVVLERGVSFGHSALNARLSELRSQLRYVQLSAMKAGVSLRMVCDGAQYWAQYNDNSSVISLPAEKSAKVALSDKSLQMSAFDLYFDSLGIPYDGVSGAKLASSLTIAVKVDGVNGTIGISPETGFVQ